jgi:opacity protein-like surface antigen
MPFSRLKLALLAGLVSAAGAAQAADYGPPPPPMPPPPAPIIVQQPAEDCCDGWYLRGHVGIGMNVKPNIDYIPAPANVGNGFFFEHIEQGDSYFLGGGAGYQWNGWLRTDFTVDYRAKSHVYAWGIYQPYANGAGDAYQGYLSSWVFLANAYVDLGTWNCFTPFVGAGIGTAYNKVSDFTDFGFGTAPPPGRGIGRDSSKWSLAWAAYAGLAYTVSKNLKIELTYRYLNYGDVTETVDCIGGCNADSYKFRDLHSHDIMFGFRWNCCEVEDRQYVQKQLYVPPPVYTQPPVVYSPPPLRSRG